MNPSLLKAALALYERTHDPLLLDSVRVLASRNQPEALIRMATSNVEACLEAYNVLYGSDGIHFPDEI